MTQDLVEIKAIVKQKQNKMYLSGRNRRVSLRVTLSTI